MTPPGPPPGPPGASYPPYTTSSSIPGQLLSLLMQAQQRQQRQAQDQQAQQQERERERQADRRFGQLEAITAFQALLAAQRQQAVAAPNARAALQELTRMVTASCSTSGGHDVLSSFPERRQLHLPPANNNNNNNSNAMTGGGLSSSSATTGTLLEQLLLRELQQQQRQASASSQQTIPPAATIRSMTENSMDNTSAAAWATSSNNQTSNLRHTGQLNETTATTTTTTTTTTLASKAKIPKTTTSPQKERHENFPEKLHRMLTELEAKGQDDIISFSAEGDTFEIHQPEVFEDEIIPLYFHHSKLGSFKRQLGLYAFKRVGKGRIEMEYHHEFFCRGEPGLLSRIKRACKKKNCRDSSKTSTAAAAAVQKKEVMTHDDDEDDDDDVEACERK